MEPTRHTPRREWPDPMINRESPVPLHTQFRQYLVALIERGELDPGAQVPRERELAERHGVSLAPVRQAILDLVKEGYFYRVRGKGTFVREAKVEEKISILGIGDEQEAEEDREGHSVGEIEFCSCRPP